MKHLSDITSGTPKRLVATVAVIAASLLVAGCFPRIESRTPPIETAEQAPDFALEDTAGKTHRLSEMIADGPAVVIFYRGYW